MIVARRVAEQLHVRCLDDNAGRWSNDGHRGALHVALGLAQQLLGALVAVPV